jgi:hypothetical protein
MPGLLLIHREGVADRPFKSGQLTTPHYIAIEVDDQASDKFAPSPAGRLHPESVHAMFINWAIARNCGCTPCAN